MVTRTGQRPQSVDEASVLGQLDQEQTDGDLRQGKASQVDQIVNKRPVVDVLELRCAESGEMSAESILHLPHETDVDADTTEHGECNADVVGADVA